MISPMTKTILKADATVSALVDDVYVTYAPSKANHTTYCLITILPVQRGQMTSSGQMPTRTGVVIINCIANDEDVAFNLSEAVQNAMSNAEGTTILGAELKGVQIDNYEPQAIEQEGDETPEAYGYTVEISYLI